MNKIIIIIIVFLSPKVIAGIDVNGIDNKKYEPESLPVISIEDINKPIEAESYEFITYYPDDNVEVIEQVKSIYSETILNYTFDTENSYTNDLYPRIFTTLERVDNTSYPWKTIVKLIIEKNNGDIVTCTGTLIQSKIVLTAGHCLYREGSWAKSISVIPGYNGLASNTEPFGNSYGIEFSVSKEWFYDNDYRHDFGLIILKSPLGDEVGWLGVGYKDDCSFFLNHNNTFHYAGYPAEAPYDGRIMYYSYGSIDFCSIQLSPNAPLEIVNRGFMGTSGSALYYKDSNDNRTVYAVLKGILGSTGNLFFGRITKQFFTFIINKINEIKESEPQVPNNPPVSDPPNSGNTKNIKVLAGFGINGTESKRILFRGLKVENIDPTLIVLEHETGKVMGSNDNWRSHSSANEILKLQSIYQFPHEEDAGMILNLPPGAYDVALGSNNGPGRGIVGINVIDGPFGNSRVINISTNSPKVYSDSKVFAGFVITGFKPNTKKVLIRAVKVDNNVDPTILVLDSNTKKIIRFNDNWRDDPSASSILKLPNRFHLPHEQDAGMILDLQPGTYDVVMDNPGINNIEGRAIISVNDIDQSNRKTTLINISTNAFIPFH